MTAPAEARAARALEVLADLAGVSPFAARVSLAGHYSRLEGMTAADLDEQPEQVPASVRALARGALTEPLTPLAAAALRLAEDHPGLETMSKRDRAAVGRRYLPEQVLA